MSTVQGEEAPLDLLIVGAGFSGLAMAICADAAGLSRFLILEKGAQVGGTWRDNTYPGAASDILSHLYSLSFAPRAGWSRRYPRQPELQAYLTSLVGGYGPAGRLRLNTDVRAARWDEAAALWRVETDHGPFRARALVCAVGGLHHPALPDLPGLACFEGPCFHTARWDAGCVLADRRVGIVGTGASAVQVIPEIAPQVAHLSVFQRSPPWVLPRWDMPFSDRERWAFAHLPLARRLHRQSVFWRQEMLALFGFTRLSRLTATGERAARAYLRATVKDEALRERLTPRYRIGCKRVLISDDYYAALSRPNVSVVSEPIRAVRPHGIVTADDLVHPLDVLILATGFDVTGSFGRLPITGRANVSLAQAWHEGIDAFQGISVHGFPNLFLLLGPNTGLGHNSVLLMMEAQVAHILGALRHLARHPGAALEVRREAQARFREGVDARMRGSIWTSGGCASWYLDAAGRNRTLWPGSVLAYRRGARWRRRDYETARAGT